MVELQEVGASQRDFSLRVSGSVAVQVAGAECVAEDVMQFCLCNVVVLGGEQGLWVWGVQRARAR